MAALEPGQEVGAIFTGVRVIDENDNVREEHPNVATAASSRRIHPRVVQGRDGPVPLQYPVQHGRTERIGGFASKKNLYDDLVPTFTLVARYGRADVRDMKAAFRRHSSNRGATVPLQDWIEDSLYVLDVIDRLLPHDRQR